MNRLHAFVSLLAIVFRLTATAEVKVPSLFADHMVLQRGMEAPIWGTASPGEKIIIHIADKTVSATADEKANWLTRLPAFDVGQASSMNIASDMADSKAIVITDLLIGDVWICSGQSNMGFQLRQCINGAVEVQNAKHANVRLFHFPQTVSVEPTKQVKGEWKTCTPESANTFSAVGYFFGREMSQRENVPIGLIANPWGGMPAEAFTSREALEADPDLRPLVELKEKTREGWPAKKAQYDKQLKQWQSEHYTKDPGNTGFEKGWAKSDFDDSTWKSMKAPAKWETIGLDIDGAVWFRKTIEIPKQWEGKAVVVSLGILDDFDTTYFNGEKIGAIGPDNVFAWAAERKYAVPADQVKAGKAVIATRIFDQWMEGGFNKPEDALRISLADDPGKWISLAGEWKYEVEYAVKQPKALPHPPAAPFSPESPSAASNLFNGMVNPVIPYGIKGAIWYQGESNASRAEQYRKLFPAMIADWRKNWGQGDFPFLFVQLANYSNFKPRPEQPADSTWAELREAQTMTLSKSPNTGMAVIIDIGESNDIHPRNKQDVGKRLALAAEKIVYQKNIESAGPMYESMKADGANVHVKFSHADGLMSKNGAPKGFAIAGDDKKFNWADAKIDGDEVILSAKDVEHPVAVRYAWADDPETNLYNAAGLPACPFRTDDWPTTTAGVLLPGGKSTKK